MAECIFCREQSNKKFRNKDICNGCIEQIKLIFKNNSIYQKEIKEIEQIQNKPTETQVVEKKNSAPVIIELKRIRR
jgi:trans-2-enoyl-CoA reductase